MKFPVITAVYIFMRDFKFIIQLNREKKEIEGEQICTLEKSLKETNSVQKQTSYCNKPTI